MDDEHRPAGPTGALTPEALEQLRAMRQTKARGAAASLLLYHRDGVQVVPLREGSAVVVGRDAPADVAIRDASLSRQHACFELLDGQVWVEDLQSTNGTWVRGDRVERLALEPGAELTLGTVPASIHALAPIEGDRFGRTNHDRFLLDLEAEVRRAAAFGRDLSLLMVRTGRRGRAHVSGWLPALRRGLTPFEPVAVYSTDTVEVLLPEADPERARARAKELLRVDEPLVCGVGVYPHCAGSAGELMAVARDALQRADLTEPIQLAPATSAPRITKAAGGDGPIVQSQAMERLYATLERLAGSVIPVLLLGETGTGKEVVARTLHERGPRRGRSLICVNCAAIPDQLVESTLFGHERGAFTGADRKTTGVFESADGGTVLLDEVGELPAQAQAALLRVLETRRFTRVGANREIEVDVRVVAATHRDLECMVAAGDFREDLLYRLNAMTLTIPPLRDRPEEIEPLARRFMAGANAANGCQVRDIAPDALDLLLRHDWPGNVRELRNAIERAVVIAADDVVAVDDLPDRVRQKAILPDAADTAGDSPPATAEGDVNLRAELARIEAEMIRRAMERSHWDRNRAAASLGLPLRTLARKIADHGIVR
jgi:DNA-binding NtrC family response regulator